MNSSHSYALDRFRATLIGILFIGFISACTPQSIQPSERQVSQWVEQLNVIYDEYFQASLKLEPLRATYLGEHKYNNLLPDTLSSEHRERVRMLEEEYLASVQRFAFEHLPEDAQLSYQIFVRDREMALMALTHPAHLMPLNQFYNNANQLAILGSGTFAQPFQAAHHYTMWDERMRAIPNLIDGIIRNREEGIEQDIVQPRVLMERALDQIAADLLNELTDSLFYQPVMSMPEEFSEQEVLDLSLLYTDLIAETLLPAYQRLYDVVRDDEQFHYASREEMLADYRAFARAVEETSAQVFFPDMLPQAGYEIPAVETFRERSASSGSYSVPSKDGLRPGIFYLNTYNLAARPTWAKAALILHEAGSGHHYQLALQREMDSLPPFRKFGGETAFIEGWGLYAESLGIELGVYGPCDRYGANIAELWRAIRLVMDTGIHAKS